MKYCSRLLILLFVILHFVPLAQITNTKLTSLVFTHQSGFYQNNFYLDVSTNDSSLKIHYTNDGSIPSYKDSVFTRPILISNQSEKENTLSSISTSERWEEPKELICKGTVIRAMVFQDTMPVSSIYSKTYFVKNKTKYSLPVISIITDSLNLFQEDSGIYIIGNNTNYSNRGRAWERLAHFEYFDIDGKSQLKQNIGIRIHGNWGRAFPQKSLRLYARSEYGSKKFNYQFFPNKEILSFKRLILRAASSTDWKNTLFKNELAQQLTANLNLSHQASIPVIVFINGEYWGIHHLSERVDKYYLNEYYQAPKDSIDLLSNSGTIEEGSSSDFLDLINYIETYSVIENHHYQYITELIDIENFIDYNISHIFLANTDWPNNNIKFWKTQNNGKWKWIMTDCDESMNYELYNVLSDFVNAMPYHQYFPQWSTFLLHNLLKNELFKRQFRSRFETLLLNNFSTTNILHEISLLKNTYTPEVIGHINRWGTPATFSDWQEIVEGLNAFAALRPIEMKSQLNNSFKSPIITYPNPANNNIHISLLIESNSNIYLNMYNLLGDRVAKNQYENSTAFNKCLINVSSLDAGIYIVEIEVNQYRYMHKIVIK